MKKSQDELYFDVIRALVAASIEGMVMDSLEIKMPVKEIPGRSGWIERMPTGWRELKITLRPKIKTEFPSCMGGTFTAERSISLGKK